MFLSLSQISGQVRRLYLLQSRALLDNAYNDKSLRAKLYADIYRQLKREFGIDTYKAIKRNQAGLALEIVEQYRPPMVLAQEIEWENAQMRMA